MPATTTINATYQGYVLKATSETKAFDWVTAIRNGTTGTSNATYTSNALDDSAVWAYYFFNSKTSAYVGGCSRTFLFFDVSSITGSNTITNAELRVLGYSTSTGDVIPVLSSAWGGDGSTTTLANADYDNVTQATTYSSAITSWNTSSYNTFTLNASAISAMNSNEYFNVALINDTYDQGASNPSGDFQNGVEFLDGTSNIQLYITYGATGGYGNDVNGVTSSDIVSVKGVATADIVNIIGAS